MHAREPWSRTGTGQNARVHGSQDVGSSARFSGHGPSHYPPSLILSLGLLPVLDMATSGNRNELVESYGIETVEKGTKQDGFQQDVEAEQNAVDIERIERVYR